VELELARNSQLLLLSAFLASHNPAGTDRRSFSVAATGRARAASRPTLDAAVRAKERAALLGPRAAPYERVVSIFYALLAAADDRATPRDADTAKFAVPHHDLLLQLGSMCALGLVERVSPATEGFAPRYRANIGLDAAAALAAALHMRLDRFLHDAPV
jgi:hypothetical protein